MRKLIWISLVLVAGLTLGACAQTPAAQQESATASPSPVPTNTVTGSLPTPAPVKTPTQQSTPALTSNEIPPVDITQILADLASKSNVPADQIKLTYWQPVDWRDACLGVHLPKQGCADVITPGFYLLFQAGQATYAVHTDATGKNYRLLQASTAQDSASLDQLPAVSWTHSGGFAGICQNLTAYSTGSYWLRNCNTSQIMGQGVLPEAGLTYLNGLWEKYGTFEWNVVQPAGSADMFNDQIKFFSRGTEPMTADEQQNLSQYLAQLVNELTSSSGANTATSGITGQVLVGPTCGGPVGAKTSTQCADKPYPTTVTVLDQSGQTVTTFTTDSDGRFRVALQPGTYTLHPASTGTFPTAVDQTIQVVSGQYLTVTIMYDSGLR